MSNERGSVPSDPELNAIAAALSSLAPARSRLDRDRLMFRAGQASASAARPAAPGREFWAAAAACLGLIASGEGALLACRPVPRIVERIVVVRQPAPAPAAPTSGRGTGDEAPAPATVVLAGTDPTLGRTARERLAGQVLRYGLDGLPAAPSAGWADGEPSPRPSRQWLHEELHNTLDPGDPS
jgi:hypothetical protein